MKKTLKIGLLLLVLLSISFVCTSCKQEEKEKEKTTYYDVVGEGYVLMYDTLGNFLYPIEGAEIVVYTYVESPPRYYKPSSPKDFFSSDSTGKYQVRFIKHALGYASDVKGYNIDISYYYTASSARGKSIKLTVDDIKNAQYILTLDTFKIIYDKWMNIN